MARRRFSGRRRGGFSRRGTAGRFAGARLGGRNLRWALGFVPPDNVANPGTPLQVIEDKTFNNWGYMVIPLFPVIETSANLRGGVHTVKRIVGNMHLWADRTEGTVSAGVAYVSECIQVIPLDDDDQVNKDRAIPWMSGFGLDSQRIMWMRDHVFNDYSEPSTAVLTGTLQPSAVKDLFSIDVKVRRRIDYSQYFIAYCLAFSSGTSGRLRVHGFLRQLFRANGSLTTTA